MPPTPHDGRRGRWLVISLLGVSAILAAVALKYRTSAWRVPPHIPSTAPTANSAQNLPQ